MVVYWGPGPYESSDERLARIGIVRVPAEQAVGMSAKDFGKAVRDMRGYFERGKGKKKLSKAEKQRRRTAGAAKVVLGLAVGSEAYERGRRR